MKFELNSSGVSDLLRSKEIQAILLDKGNEISERAGDGFEVKVSPGQKRANATVSTTDIKSMAKNAKDNTLLKALR
nr:MAG TPA: type I neck protein [Caudoviricetes sp.]